MLLSVLCVVFPLARHDIFVPVVYALGDSGVANQAQISRLLTALLHLVNSLGDSQHLCAAYLFAWCTYVGLV